MSVKPFICLIMVTLVLGNLHDMLCDDFCAVKLPIQDAVLSLFINTVH